MEDCLFCKFVSGEFATNKVFENEDFIVIRDINPQAKNHFLIIPKKHFKYLAEMTEGIENRPFMVMDDGWQIDHSDSYNGGPWRVGNADYGFHSRSP